MIAEPPTTASPCPRWRCSCPDRSRSSTATSGARHVIPAGRAAQAGRTAAPHSTLPDPGNQPPFAGVVTDRPEADYHDHLVRIRPQTGTVDARHHQKTCPWPHPFWPEPPVAVILMLLQHMPGGPPSGAVT
jgi:hypothetical protein